MKLLLKSSHFKDMVVPNSNRKYKEIKMVETQGVDYNYLGWKLPINSQPWGNSTLKDINQQIILKIITVKERTYYSIEYMHCQYWIINPLSNSHIQRKNWYKKGI